MTTNTAEFVFSITRMSNEKMILIPVGDYGLYDKIFEKAIFVGVPKVREIVSWFHQREIDCSLDFRHRDQLSENGEMVITGVDIVANIPTRYLAGLEPKYDSKPFEFERTVYAEMEKFRAYIYRETPYFPLYTSMCLRTPLCDLDHLDFTYGNYSGKAATVIGAFFDYTFEKEGGGVSMETELVFSWGVEPEENCDVVWDKRDIYREVAERLKAISSKKKNVRHNSTYMVFGHRHRYMFEPLALYSDNPLPG